MRHTWRHFMYTAHCEDCRWTLRACNALGPAAQHHDRTGHSVYIAVEGFVQYLSDTDHRKAVELTKLDAVKEGH